MTSKILKLWKDAFNNDNETMTSFNKTMTTDRSMYIDVKIGEAY